MKLDLLSLQNFRSYKQKRLQLHPGLNLVVGKNGTGKTNLLEALYLIATTKSFRAADEALLMHGASWFKVTARAGEDEFKITYQQKPRRKAITINNKTAKAMDYVGRLPVVLFEPQNLNIASGSPVYRRQFLDATLSGLDPEYLEKLIKYRRVLKQRNALLRSNTTELADQIFAWDLKLAELAGYLVKKRIQFVSYLNSRIEVLYGQIAGQRLKITISYRSSIDSEDYGSSLLAALKTKLRLDQLTNHTSVGPHRDDMAINFDSHPIQVLASRGEIRSIVLACKILESEFVKDQLNKQPLLLLDDVFSELDTSRRQFLSKVLTGHQSVITATDTNGIKGLLKTKHAIFNLS